MGNCGSDSSNPNAFTPKPNGYQNHQRPPVAVGGFPGSTYPPPAANDNRDPDVVYATVPPGVYAGQTINVAASDGSGRVVSAVVPNGMGPGSQFIVRLPPLEPSAPPMMVPAQPVKADYTTTAAVPTSSINDNNYNKTADNSAYPVAAATLVEEQTHNEPPPFSLALELPPPVQNSNAFQTASTTTMAAPPPPPMQPQYQPPTEYQPSPSTSVPNSNGQKLLRVQVPPGVAPGTTISVQVPDEPGRVLSVQVPPNTTEFNVAYDPMTVPTVSATSSSFTYGGSSSMNNNNNNVPYSQPYSAIPPTQPPPYNPYAPNNNGYNNNNGGYNNNNNNGYNNSNNGYNNNNNNGYDNNGYNNNNNKRPGMGGYILPVLGGAAVGIAAMELVDAVDDDLFDW